MIAIGSDGAGYNLKTAIAEHLKERGIEFKDFGTVSSEAVDYPLYAKKVANAVTSGECELGILCCGTGIGVSIAANKVKGVRCALCHDCFSAEAARQHNDANIIALGERVIGVGNALKVVDTFLDTDFSNVERHVRRVGMIE